MKHEENDTQTSMEREDFEMLSQNFFFPFSFVFGHIRLFLTSGFQEEQEADEPNGRRDCLYGCFTDVGKNEVNHLRLSS